MPQRFIPLALCCLLLLAGCQKEEIKTYRIAKEQTPQGSKSELPPGHPPTTEAASPAPMPAQAPMPAAAEGQELVWSAPKHWQSLPADAMRKGHFTIPGDAGARADLSIFAFPGAAGGLAGNINRWRNQLGMPPLDDEGLTRETSRLKADSGMELVVVDIANPSGERILGAIIERTDASWFFKLRGPSALVAREKDAFLSFLKTVKQP